MTRKRSIWLVGTLVLALAVSGTLFVRAQDKEDDEKEVHSYVFRSVGGRARLGVGVAEVTAEKARELKLAGEYGALVTEVAEGSPAAEAGLQEDDVIVEFDGERVRSASHLVRLVRETPAGRSVELKVSRAGQTRALTAKLEERHARFRMPAIRIPIPDVDVRVRPDIRIFSRRARLGITADDLTEQLADYFGVEQGEGVLVREVLKGTPAEKAGLKAGDVIVRVDDEKVESVSDLRHALAESTREKEKVTLTIIRNRAQQTLDVEIKRAQPLLPRRSVEFLDLEPELEEWAAEIRSYATEAQEFAEELKKEWQDNWLDWGEQWEEQWRRHERDWRRQWRERERELKRKLREEFRLLEPSDGGTVRRVA